MSKLNLKHNLPLALSLAVVTVSLPLALFVALTQQTNLESNASAKKTSWEFNKKGNSEGWTASGFIKSPEVSGGNLKVTTVNTQGREIAITSSLFSPEIQDPRQSGVNKLQLRLRVNKVDLPQQVIAWANKNSRELVTKDDFDNYPYPQVKSKMIVQWAYNDDGGNSTISEEIFLDVLEDGKYHTYILDLKNNPTWNKYIVKYLRITPTTSSNSNIYLDWVRLKGEPRVVTSTPTPTPPVEIQATTLLGKVVKYNKTTVLGVETENLNDSSVSEYDQPDDTNVLGTQTSCSYDQTGKPVCALMEIYPICKNGSPVWKNDQCGCPRLVCPTEPTPTVFPPETIEYALLTDDGKNYLLKDLNTFVLNKYLDKTVFVEGKMPKNISFPCQGGSAICYAGEITVDNITIANRSAVNQTFKGYLTPATRNNDGLYVFTPQKKIQPGNPGESDSSASPKFYTLVRSSKVNLANFVDQYVTLVANVYFLGEELSNQRLLDVNTAVVNDPISVTITLFPSPTIVCRNTVSNSEYYVPCGTNTFRYTRYTCTDGTVSILGSPDMCKTQNQWVNEAKAACEKTCKER